jgi:HK97 family phage portal protein
VSVLARAVAAVGRGVRAAVAPGELRYGYRPPGHTYGSLYSLSTSGVVVSPETALTLAAAFACINVLASDTAMLPFHVYRRRKGGGKDVASDFWPDQMLSLSPSREHDSITLRQAAMGHVLGWGNGYMEIVRDPAGRPREMVPLDPRWGQTQPYRDRDGGISYKIHGGVGPDPYLRQADVLHIAGLGWDGLIGYSPVAMCRQAIGLGLACEAAGGTLFGNGLNVQGILTTKKRLTPDGRKNLRESLEYVHAGPYNANRLLILEEDSTFLQTSIDPDDAQFLATRAFQVLEVCRLYRCPPHKAMDYSQAHLANLEQSNTDYLQTSLMPWLIKWEQQCNRKLLTAAQRAAGYECSHDVSALLRGDSAARAQLHKTLLECGATSPNLIAGIEGLPPTAGGDVHILPMNMVSVPELARAGSAPAEPPLKDRLEDAPELPVSERWQQNGHTHAHAHAPAGSAPL